MIGAIIGDIVGSVYEWNNIKTKEFPLFRDDCFFTDDTVMTCAVAEAVMNGGKRDDFIDAMKKYGRMYPDAGYGGRFGSWLFSDTREAYNSYGNGSAMRVSPCAWVMDCGFCAGTGMWPSNGRAGAQLSAEVTHNHPEGVKGAMATADAISSCAAITSAAAMEITSGPSTIIRLNVKSESKSILSGSMATICLVLLTKFGLHTILTKPAKILCRKLSLLF